VKPEKVAEQDRILDQALVQWVVKSPLPARFEERVWQRISRAESALTFGTVLRSAVSFVQAAFSRPKVAYSYLAVLLVLGIAAGSLAAQQKNSRFEASLGSRYLQSVDPFQPSSR
jgi:hypothetical protein